MCYTQGLWWVCVNRNAPHGKELADDIHEQYSAGHYTEFKAYQVDTWACKKGHN